jgi:integrase
LGVGVRHTWAVTSRGVGGPFFSPGDLRVQIVNHRDGRRSWVVLDSDSGCVHTRADRFLARFDEGTQATYAYHLIDHLRWLAATERDEATVTVEDLRRFMALCGAEQSGPLGVPWRDRPLGEAALAVRAACLKGYYLDVTTREGINEVLREALSARRSVNGHDRDRSALGHLMTSVPSNPLSGGAPPRRHPRLLPDGTRDAMVEAVRTARDRMIVMWLSDSGMRIGELCGLWFCDLHLRRDHPCGERKGPHVHIVKRRNPNHARAKTAFPARVVEGVVTGGTVRRASPAMVDSYHEYLAEDYHRVRAVALSDLVLVHLVGETAGQPLSTHGARQMLERAGRRASLGVVKPHAFRHTWATALTEATGGNTKAVADEGGWSSSRTVEDTYAHLAGDPTLEAALEKIWSENL